MLGDLKHEELSSRAMPGCRRGGSAGALERPRGGDVQLRAGQPGIPERGPGPARQRHRRPARRGLRRQLDRLQPGQRAPLRERPAQQDHRRNPQYRARRQWQHRGPRRLRPVRVQRHVQRMGGPTAAAQRPLKPGRTLLPQLVQLSGRGLAISGQVRRPRRRGHGMGQAARQEADLRGGRVRGARPHRRRGQQIGQPPDRWPRGL